MHFNNFTMDNFLTSLQLLGDRYPHPEVRKFAVKNLEGIPPSELRDYLPQLIQVYFLIILSVTNPMQVLKKEQFHFSAVSDFLIRQSLADFHIAHSAFWQLKSELDATENTERFQLMLEALLFACGQGRKELLHEDEFIRILNSIALSLKETKLSEREATFKYFFADSLKELIH